MLRRIVLLGCMLAAIAASPVQAGDLMGTWTANLSDDDAGKLDFSFNTGRGDMHGTQIGRTAFTGLTAEQIESHTRVPVQFTLQRQAGTLTLDGTFRNGRGAGDFTFVSDPEYLRRLKAAKVPFKSNEVDDERELLNLALFDVSIEFIRSMQAIGYEERLDKYVAFRIFGIDPAYVREMAKVGYDDLTADKLTETKIHGVTPAYIREMRAKGENLTLDGYIQSRIFQVTPEFASEIAKAGYANLERDMLVQFRIHGVNPEFIQELREVGYSRLPAQKLVEMRIHGVTPEFIRRVEKAGYKNVPVDKLVQMRIFDIDPEMVRALEDASGR
jgi:hypothetical protein